MVISAWIRSFLYLPYLKRSRMSQYGGVLLHHSLPDSITTAAAAYWNSVEVGQGSGEVRAVLVEQCHLPPNLKER